MKSTWKWILATFMIVVACNALATAGENDITFGSHSRSSNTPRMTQQKPHQARWRPVRGIFSRGKGYFYQKFELQLRNTDECVRVLANHRLRLRPCNRGGKLSRVFWTARNDGSGTIGRYSWAKSCLWAPDVFAGHRIRNRAVFTATCTDGIKSTLFGYTHTFMREIWVLLGDGRIALAGGGLETNGRDLRYTRFDHTPQCLEYSSRQARVIVANCVYGKPTQYWRPVGR